MAHRSGIRAAAVRGFKQPARSCRLRERLKAVIRSAASPSNAEKQAA
jgi:hypothetical protein